MRAGACADSLRRDIQFPGISRCARIFARPSPGVRARRSQGGECEPMQRCRPRHLCCFDSGVRRVKPFSGISRCARIFLLARVPVSELPERFARECEPMRAGACADSPRRDIQFPGISPSANIRTPCARERVPGASAANANPCEPALAPTRCADSARERATIETGADRRLLLLLVTRTGIEPMFPACEASVLTA